MENATLVAAVGSESQRWHRMTRGRKSVDAYLLVAAPEPVMDQLTRVLDRLTPLKPAP